MTPTPTRRRHLTDEQAMAELAAVLDRHAEEDYAAKWTAEKRRQAEKNGDAMAGGKYPIVDQEDVRNAMRLVGNGSAANSAVVAHIKKQVRKHGLSMPPSLR